MAPGDLQKLVLIREYEADDLLMYTHYWRCLSENSRAVDYLCRLQERIPGCEIPAGISQEIDLEDSKPNEAQMILYRDMIHALRPLPMEHVVFIFMNDGCAG